MTAKYFITCYVRNCICNKSVCTTHKSQSKSTNMTTYHGLSFLRAKKRIAKAISKRHVRVKGRQLNYCLKISYYLYYHLAKMASKARHSINIKTYCQFRSILPQFRLEIAGPANNEAKKRQRNYARTRHAFVTHFIKFKDIQGLLVHHGQF